MKIFLCLALAIAAAAAQSEPRIQDDPDRSTCLWRHGSGSSNFFLVGIPNSAYTVQLNSWEKMVPHRTRYDGKDPYDKISWRDFFAGIPKPPRGWDGRASTLGYKMPKKVKII